MFLCRPSKLSHHSQGSREWPVWVAVVSGVNHRPRDWCNGHYALLFPSFSSPCFLFPPILDSVLCLKYLRIPDESWFESICCVCTLHFWFQHLASSQRHGEGFFVIWRSPISTVRGSHTFDWASLRLTLPLWYWTSAFPQSHFKSIDSLKHSPFSHFLSAPGWRMCIV